MKGVKFFVNKSISVSHLGGWVAGLCGSLYEAASSVSYLEGLSRKADALHKYVKLSDESSLKRIFELVVRDGLKRLKLGEVELAVDTTKDLYYGKEYLNTRRVKNDRGTDLAWEFVVISIVKPVKLPLMVVPYGMGKDLAVLVIDLLKYVQTLGVKIKTVYFDRGFYNWYLIDYLESSRLPYLIFVPKNDRIKDFIDRTKGKLGCYAHRGKYSRDKSTWKAKTKIVVCKDVWKSRKGQLYDMCFATNLKPRYSLVIQYKRRWNIETGFRIMKEAKVKTKSNHSLIRLFYFMLRALFSLLWVVRRYVKGDFKTIFKIFLKMAAQYNQDKIILSKFALKRPP